MTEIQWLCDILLNFKLPKEVKDRFISRIGEVEASLTRQQPPRVQPLVQPQAPSTQRLLETQDPIVVSPPPVPATPKNTLINNGDGTYGKRKW